MYIMNYKTILSFGVGLAMMTGLAADSFASGAPHQAAANTALYRPSL
jgi:hypothetical protein